MQIAIASGKGGTGKTMVATNLAALHQRAGRKVQLLDADVEEPNGHLFTKPQIESSRPVTVGMPEVNADKCTHCGICSQFCQFGAIVAGAEEVIVFPELCHSCGGCMQVCPERAIREVNREVGWLDEGASGDLLFVQGRLKVGEPRAVPIISELRQQARTDRLVLIDTPPGTSCAVIEAIRDVDFVCLVTEPTPFGLYDLELAVELVRTLGLALGVVINRAGLGDGRVGDFCREGGIPILAEIPSDKRIARAGAGGDLILDAVPELEGVFASLADEIETGVLT